MVNKAGIGNGIVGLMFLALGVIKMLKGSDWVVWIILGVLFGGLGVFGGIRKERDES